MALICSSNGRSLIMEPGSRMGSTRVPGEGHRVKAQRGLGRDLPEEDVENYETWKLAPRSR
jgi:hypothetical protein